MEIDDELGGDVGLDFDMDGIDEMDGELGGVEDEADRNSAVALLDRLRAVVRQRLGTLEQGFGAEFEGQPARQLSKFNTPNSQPKPNHIASLEPPNSSSSLVASSRLVESARAVAELNASSLDGADGPGAARHQFRDICGKLRRYVVQPYANALGGLDKTQQARTRNDLRSFGDKASRLKALTTRAKRLQDYSKVQRDERAVGLDRKYGSQSLCLPSKMFKLAEDLGLDFMNELEEESKIYISHGQYLLLEFTYAGDGEISLSAQLVNENGETTTLVDEANDILDSFKNAKQRGGLRLLHAKFKALIRRSDLEVALNAGSLHDLSKDVEAALSEYRVKRVARGLETSLPARAVTKGYLARGDAPHSASVSDASQVIPIDQAPPQRILTSLSARHDINVQEADLEWQDKTALIVSFEPPIEFGITAAETLLAISKLPATNKTPATSSDGTMDTSNVIPESDLTQGAALALLFAQQGKIPIEDNALQAPPQINIAINVHKQARRDGTINRIRLRVATGSAHSHGRNLSTIAHQLALHPKQHGDLPLITSRIAQQIRFNALLASAVFHPKMEVTRPSLIASDDDGRLLKKSKTGVNLPTHNNNERHRRILMCPARRESMLKASHLPRNPTSIFGDEDEDAAALLGGSDSKSDNFEVDQERVIVLHALPPTRLQFMEGEHTVLDIVLPEDNSPLQTSPPEMAEFLESSPSVPLALAKLLGFLDQ